MWGMRGTGALAGVASSGTTDRLYETSDGLAVNLNPNRGVTHNQSTAVRNRPVTKHDRDLPTPKLTVAVQTYNGLASPHGCGR